MKLERYTEALNEMFQVLKMNPKDEKALYRKVQINIKLIEYEKAESDLKLLLEINPENLDVLTL